MVFHRVECFYFSISTLINFYFKENFMQTINIFYDENPTTQIKQSLELLFDTYIDQFYAESKVNSTTSSKQEDVQQ